MRRLVVLPLAALTVVVALAAPVAAATTTHYSPRAAARGTAAVSPSGCYQKANNPHRSEHFGWIAGEVKTQCRIFVPKISQVAQLWEGRWWGWDRVGTRPNETVYWKRYQSISANVTCRHSSMKVTGSGSVIDVDEHTYYASTESNHVNNPCGL
ncbi:MAG TPA: hypothetical protein VH914_21055 [Acidimicrobiia bacterium]|jgi:hypothetical protein|nr:hypothetical protein [Acidimicrobiia bacterium]